MPDDPLSQQGPRRPGLLPGRVEGAIVVLVFIFNLPHFPHTAMYLKYQLVAIIQL